MQVIAINVKAKEKSEGDIPKKDKQVFIENKGQWDSEVLFMTQQDGLNAWITKHGVVYDFFKFKESKVESKVEGKENEKLKQNDIITEGQIVKVSIENCNNSPKAIGIDKKQGSTNFYIGNDKSKWVSNVSSFKEVSVGDCLSNIDSRYYFDEGKLRYDYILKPGSNPNDIVLSIEGSDINHVNEIGDLVFKTKFGEVTQSKLFAYQEIEGKKVQVACKFKLSENGKFGFETGAYDNKKPLVIDPIVYCTYLGGIKHDNAPDIDVWQNHAFIVATSFSVNFPTTSGAYSFSGIGDVVVTKFATDALTLDYSTFIGGSGSDYGFAIKVNSIGEATICGHTASSNFALSSTSFSGGGTDGFVCKLNATGQITNSRLFGGDAIEFARDLAIDASGNTFITGSSNSLNLNPTSISGPLSGNSNTGLMGQNIYIAKFNANLTLNYFKLIGGTGENRANAIDIDNLGNAYITGYANMGNYPASGYFSNGVENIVITKLNANGINLDYSVFRSAPSQGNSRGISLVTGQNGELFVTGQVVGSIADITIPTPTGIVGPKVFIARVGSNGANLAFRLVGSQSLDAYSGDIKLDNCNNLVISGWHEGSSFFPSFTSPSLTPSFSGVKDLFVFSVDQPLQNFGFSTSIGGSSFDVEAKIAIDQNNDIYIAGYTQSADIPINPPNVFDPTINGMYDLFLTKFSASTLPTFTISNPCLPAGGNITATVTSPIGAGVTYSLNGGTPQSSPVFTINSIGTYTISVSSVISCATSTFMVTSCINCPQAPAGTPIYSNILASTAFPSGTMNTPVILDGVITVDNLLPNNELAVVGNPNVFFTANSRIELNNNTILSISQSTLQGCDKMWDGIHANTSSKHIKIRSSILKDMTRGVFVENSAKLDADGSKFYNNRISIFINFNSLAGTVKLINNEFETTAPSLLPPLAAWQQGEIGIFIQKSRNVIVGDPFDALNINTFKKLFCGVSIVGGITNVGFNTNKIYNAQFTNISNLNPNTTYASGLSSREGWAIHSIGLGQMQKLNVEIGGINSKITTCDKGIYLRRTYSDIRNTLFNETPFGIFANVITNSTFIKDNVMNNVTIGILKSGAESTTTNFEANNNVINISNNPNVQLQTQWGYVGGIRSDYPSANADGESNFYTNTITNNFWVGEGIPLNLGKGANIGVNWIKMPTTITSNILLVQPYLTGIKVNNSVKPSIANNIMNRGSNSTICSLPSTGLYLTKCENPMVACNTMDKLQYGIYGVGKNSSFTNTDLVYDNTSLAGVVNWMFWHFVNEDGSLGDVGEYNPLPYYAANNKNHFLGNPSLYKVYKWTDPLVQVTPDKIVTTSNQLTQGESESNINSHEYLVQNPSTFNATLSCALKPPHDPNGGALAQLDYAKALLVANDAMVYPEYPDGCDYFDERALLAWLEEHPQDRATYPDLGIFYNDRVLSTLGEIAEVERNMNLLHEEYLLANEVAWLAQWNATKNMNDVINDNETILANAKYMNNIYLKMIKTDMDNITQQEINDAVALANSCPYIDGDAVYRARVLATAFGYIGNYDDLTICNSLGVYKNGKSKYQEELEAFQTIINTSKLNALVKVYPNPATTQLTIDYHELLHGATRVAIFDMSGREVLQVDLKNSKKTISINLNGLNNGMYTYKLQALTGESYTGKFIIE